LNKISIVTLVSQTFLEFVFTSHVDDVIILLTSSVLYKIIKLTCQHNLGT
jgi:hypothetical protein